jgi:hypothetical protein
MRYRVRYPRCSLALIATLAAGCSRGAEGFPGSSGAPEVVLDTPGTLVAAGDASRRILAHRRAFRSRRLRPIPSSEARTPRRGP